LNKKHRFETKAIRSQAEKSQNREHSVPLYLTSSFTFPDAQAMEATFAGKEEGNIYSRYSNPNIDELITKVCQMEGAEDGFAVTTGMSAIFYAIIPFLKAGDHIIASRALFGSTHQMLTQILPRWNITHSYVDGSDADLWEESVQENTKLLLLETPSNPGIAIIDLEKAGDFAKRHNLIYVVDNCFATPYIQRPIEWGADLVTQDRHCSNALALAQFLSAHHRVRKVNYPFLKSHAQYDVAKKQMDQGGGVLSFEIEGGQAAAQAFKNNLKVITITSNLGDTRSIATHPATSTHSKLSKEERAAVGIFDGLIRISVGLEHIDDIIEDVEQALASNSSPS